MNRLNTVSVLMNFGENSLNAEGGAISPERESPGQPPIFRR